MARIPRVVVDRLQTLGGTRLGGALGRKAFRGLAAVIAQDFARIRGVRTVYLTGSWTRPEAAAPGYSDLDLLLSVEVPTLASELALRRGIHETQRRWNAWAKVLKHVDYVEARDLELFRRGGNCYWVDADERFVALAGESDLRPGRRVHRSRETERTISALRRWLLVSQVLLDPTFERADAITRRAAERMFAGVVADCFDVSAYTLPTELFERAIASLEGWEIPAPSAPTEAFVRGCAEATLRLLEDACTRYVRGFEEDEAALPPPPPQRFDESARAAGFAQGLLAELPPPGNSALAIVLADEPAGAAIDRLRRRWASIELPRARWDEGVRRPVLVTRPLFRAAHLFTPVPRCGASIASHRSAFGLPLRPPARVSEAMLVARRLELFDRARGHAFRVDRAPEANLRRLAMDVCLVSPRLRGDAPEAMDALDEPTLLERLRAHLDRERIAIARALEVDPDRAP